MYLYRAILRHTEIKHADINIVLFKPLMSSFDIKNIVKLTLFWRENFFKIVFP